MMAGIEAVDDLGVVSGILPQLQHKMMVGDQ